jgi:hypothetical protein
MLDRILSWVWPSVKLPTWPLRELNKLPVIRPERPQAKVLEFRRPNVSDLPAEGFGGHATHG